MVPIISNFQTMHNPNYPDTTSPIVLKVYFDGANQFAFRFKAPSTSTLQIYDGDGTLTAVAGQDATLVTHNTSYPTGKTRTFYFYVEGDYVDLTVINIQSQAFVSGDLTRWYEIPNLTGILTALTGMYGSIDGYGVLASLAQLSLGGSTGSIIGNIEILVNCSLLASIYLPSLDIHGDASTLYPLPLTQLQVQECTDVTFDSEVSFLVTNRFYTYDCGWTSTMVDNALISLAAGGTTGEEIYIAGNNAARTSASNAALLALQLAGNNITVNETLGENLIVNSDFALWTADNPDGFGHSVEDANNYVTENLGGCRFVSNGSACNIYQNPLTSGKYYRVNLDFIAYVSGILRLTTTENLSTGVGAKSVLYLATGAYITPQVLVTSAPIDLTIDNLIVQEVL